MPRYSKGSAVAHSGYGRGTVTALRHNGYEVRVSFGRYSLWIPVRELESAPGGLRLVKSPSGPREPKHSGKPSLNQIIRMLTPGAQDEDGTPEPRVEKPSDVSLEPRHTPCASGRPLEHALALEAFRLGIVPAAHVTDWTVGRDEEVAWIGRFLRDDAEGAVVIEGAYGAGKTHLLNCLAREAEGLGYAVACAGFDPSEAAAAFPKKAWRRLCRGFRAPLVGGTVDFRGFLEAVCHTPGWRDVLGRHWLLAPFLERLEADRVLERDWAFIEAREPGRARLPTLHDFTTCANLYCSLLSGLGQAAELVGLNGLAVLLDEAEVASSVLYRYQFLRGLNFYRGLVLTANDEHVLLEEDVLREEGVSVGADTGLIYSGHNPVRYTSGIPSFLKVAFALTPGSLQVEFRRYRESICTMKVDVLSEDQLRELFQRICDRFQTVYGVGLRPAGRDRLFRFLSRSPGASSTRGFIKAAVEILDSIRFYPGEKVEEVLLGTGPTIND